MVTPLASGGSSGLLGRSACPKLKGCIAKANQGPRKVVQISGWQSGPGFPGIKNHKPVGYTLGK